LAQVYYSRLEKYGITKNKIALSLRGGPLGPTWQSANENSLETVGKKTRTPGLHVVNGVGFFILEIVKEETKNPWTSRGQWRWFLYTRNSKRRNQESPDFTWSMALVSLYSK
jgi:hypothetical protein